MRNITFGMVALAGGLLALGLVLERRQAQAQAPRTAQYQEDREGRVILQQGRGYPAQLKLIAPKGVTLDPSAPISSRTDRTGTVYVAATGRTDKGTSAIVWRQRQRQRNTYESQLIDLGAIYPGGHGTLSLEADGNLYLTTFGEDGIPFRVRVPGWGL